MVLVRIVFFAVNLYLNLPWIGAVGRYTAANYFATATWIVFHRAAATIAIHIIDAIDVHLLVGKQTAEIRMVIIIVETFLQLE